MQATGGSNEQVSPVGRALILVCAVVAVAAIGLLLTGHFLLGLLVLFSPLIVVVAALLIYALFALVAFGLGRLDALRRGGYRAGEPMRSAPSRSRSPARCIARLRSWL